MSRSGDDAMQSTVQPHAPVRPARAPAPAAAEPIFDARGVNVFYGEHRAIRDVSLRIAQHEITALIGPSGCGKATFIRCLNRMNDLIPGARVHGEVVYQGEDLYADEIECIARG